MKLLLNKIKKHKQRYISIALALTIIQGIIFMAISFLTVLNWRYFPEPIFEFDSVYNLTISVDAKEKQDESEKLIFTPQFIDDINNINGIENCGGDFEHVTKYVYNLDINSKFDTTLSVFHNPAGILFHKIHQIY